ncbi:MAG: PDZ domain-containing protein [Candidatus Omnitrophota bacterium]
MKIKLIRTLIFSFILCAIPIYASGQIHANQLSFTLIGTVIESNPRGESLAIIEVVPEGLQRPYRIGERVCGYQIVKIKRAAIQILKEGKVLEVAFPLGSINQPVVDVSDTKKIIKREAMVAQIPDLNTALKQAVGVPHFEGGRIKGFKIAKINNQPLAEKVGIEEGDIVLSVNDLKLDSIKRPLEIYDKLRNQKEFTVRIKRKGEIKNLVYYLN